MIEKITRQSLRQVWKHEADFTRWLEENINVLNDALGLALVGAESEQKAGDFNVDIVAEDENGDITIIENQLEKSDHDHLGKLITYLTTIEAKAAIWIVADPRPEHVNAITWLNEANMAAFYLVKVEAIKIGSSEPAPLLTLIVGPSEEAIEAGVTKKELAGRYFSRKQFWSELLKLSKNKTKLHSNISPSKYNWIGSPAGLPRGMNLNYSVRKHDAQAELFIDTGDTDLNKQTLAKLIKNKTEIESVYGGPLEWEFLEGKRACRIKKTISIGGWMDEDKWPEVHEALINAMIQLDKALRPYLNKL